MNAAYSQSRANAAPAISTQKKPFVPFFRDSPRTAMLKAIARFVQIVANLRSL